MGKVKRHSSLSVWITSQVRLDWLCFLLETQKENGWLIRFSLPISSYMMGAISKNIKNVFLFGYLKLRQLEVNAMKRRQFRAFLCNLCMCIYCSGSALDARPSHHLKTDDPFRPPLSLFADIKFKLFWKFKRF